MQRWPLRLPFPPREAELSARLGRYGGAKNRLNRMFLTFLGGHAPRVLSAAPRRKHLLPIVSRLFAHHQRDPSARRRRGHPRARVLPRICDISARKAFTLIELLVVVSIISLLAALLLPILSRARERASGLQCLNNNRQITVAWLLYAEDHSGRLPLNMDVIDDQGVPINWVAGTMHRATDATNMALLTDPTRSLITPYLKDVRAFKCPSDESRHVRSFAMNCRMSPFRPLGPPSWVGGLGTNYQTFYSLHGILYPVNILVVVDERYDSINDAYFAIDMSNTGTPEGNGQPRPYYIIDHPASYHNAAGTVSFADGHVEIHKWLEPTTKPPLGRAQARIHTSATDRDMQWLQERSTYLK